MTKFFSENRKAQKGPRPKVVSLVWAEVW